MLRESCRGRVLRSGVVLLLLSAHTLTGQAPRQSSVERWKRWETELLSVRDYAASGGNPYRDLKLSATFWLANASGVCSASPPASCSGGTCFRGLGFWEGYRQGTTAGSYVADAKGFKLRTMLPAGSANTSAVWCWKTACVLDPPKPAGCTTSDTRAACRSTTPTCAGDTGLDGILGKITVTVPATPVTPPPPAERTKALYPLGLPAVSLDKRSLTYGDLATRFEWLGDTAWNAPIKYPIGTNATLWRAFVADRARKGFTNVLVAPAAQTSSSATVTGFRFTGSSCSADEKSLWPNPCSTWETSYWRSFDQLVQEANDQGLVVVVAGLMDPVVRGGKNNQLGLKFPYSTEAKAFARSFAARLAGSFVIFSPSYDAGTESAAQNKTPDGLDTLGLIRIVGAAIDEAAPRHLIGAHLAGSNGLSAYLSLQEESWLDLQLFQSGHGGKNAGAPCAIDGCSEDANFLRAACRAREGALEFRCIQAPSLARICSPDAINTHPVIKPAVNIEGDYEAAYVKENPCVAGSPEIRDVNNLPLDRARSRLTAWVTALSGSFGFNIGLHKDVVAWLMPESYSDDYLEAGVRGRFRSDNDLGVMRNLLRGAPWSDMEPRHNLIANNPTAQNLRRHLAVAGEKYVLVHVPGVPSNARTPTVVEVLTASPPGGPPITNLIPGLSCQGWTRFFENPRRILPDETRSDTSLQADCDDRTAGRLKFSRALPLCTDGRNDCDWVLKLAKSGSAGGNAPNVAPVSLATARSGAKVSGLNDLAVWTEADPEAQATYAVAQLLDEAGEPAGEPFRVSGSDLRFRKLPVASRDANGTFLVVWEEESDDGTDDVVSVQVSSQGVVLSTPTVLNAQTAGQQAEPSVTADGCGNSVVSWTSYDLNGAMGDVYAALVSPTGERVGDEILISGDPGNQYASMVQAASACEAVIAWTSEPPVEPSSVTAGATTKRKAEQGVYFRILRADGRPHAQTKRCLPKVPGRHSLLGLDVKPNGKFKIRWLTRSDDGSRREVFEQGFDSEGNEEGNAVRVEDHL